MAIAGDSPASTGMRLPRGLIGTTLFHAFVVFDIPGSGEALLASNPFPLTLTR